jgi:hypothetical protein
VTIHCCLRLYAPPSLLSQLNRNSELLEQGISQTRSGASCSAGLARAQGLNSLKFEGRNPRCTECRRGS